MYTFISIVSLIVIGYVVKDLYGIYKDSINTLENDYKRWSADELFVAAYVACFVEDDVRLDDDFQKLLATSLKRSERAVNEKIRRLSTVGSQKSDASEMDVDTIYAMAQMPEEDAIETLDVCLLLSGASKRQQQAILSYL